MRKKIVVIGSCNTDMVVKSDRLPVPGETVLGGAFMMNPGGKGANQAVTVARMGGSIAFVAKTGNDLFGKQSIEMYKDEAINTDYIFSDPNLPSGVALISVDTNGENCIVVASGANAALKPKDIDKARSIIEEADILLMQLEVPIETVEYAAKIAHESGVKVILNPAPAAFLSDELFKYLYAIIPNKSEAEVLSGVNVADWESAKLAADVISLKGVEIVVITLGSKGSLIKDGNIYHQIPALKINAIDTTAAGDTFCGTVCVGLSEGMKIEDAVIMATKAAGITVTRAGAQASIPYRKELTR